MFVNRAHYQRTATIGAIALLAAGAFLWLSGSTVGSSFVGFLSFLFTAFYVEGKDYRKTKYQEIRNYLDRHTFEVLKGVAFLLVIFLFAGSTPRPEADFIVAIYKDFLLFGGLIIVYFTVKPVFQALSGSKTGHAFGLLKVVAGYFGVLWLLGNFGDQVFNATMSAPLISAEYLVLALLLLAVMWFARSRNFPPSGYGSLLHSRYAVSALNRDNHKPTIRDQRYTAAHEAAHAMCYAALKTLPSDLKVVMNETPDGQNHLGYVSGPDESCLRTKEFTEWFMFLLLAGREGECLISKASSEVTLGALGDLSRWQSVAREYLKLQDHGVYYFEPKNLLEQQRNEFALSSLLASQVKELKDFLDMNKPVHARISSELLDKKQLDRAELELIFSDIQIPQGFPKIHN